jgi:hypothetical protein
MLSRNLCMAATCAAYGAVASAHHSSAAYDVTTEVVVEGTVTDLDWTNPHAYFTIETASADGLRRLQQVEVGPISGVQTYGLTREVLAPGSHVTVRANPSRRGPGRTIRGLDLTTSAGVIYALEGRGRSSARATAAVKADGLGGRWTPSSSEYRAFGQAIQSWPLTEAGRAAQARAQALQSGAYLGLCEPWPVPGLTILPALRTIEVRNDAVIMTVDSAGLEVVRTVRLGTVEHHADFEPAVQGDSIGRWEGATLVIDTIGFAPHPSGVSVGVPSSPAKHVVERLTLTEDALHIRYELAMEDPAYLAGRVSASMLWDHRPDLEPSGAACDPEVARRFLEAE